MAQIIDLEQVETPVDETFFVDTNVWFWFYAASKGIRPGFEPEEYQLQNYPKFIEEILNAGNRLVHCPLNLAELSNTIENSELALHRKYHQDPNFSKKRFRGVKTERAMVVKEIETAWKQVCSMSNCLQVQLDSVSATDCIDLLRQSLLDTYDAFYCQILGKEGVLNIITDDGDFSTTDGFNIYTSNRRLL